MAPGFHPSNGIPGHGVILALSDGLAAVWADPGLILFCVVTGGGLNRILHSALNFGPLDPDSHPL